MNPDQQSKDSASIVFLSIVLFQRPPAQPEIKEGTLSFYSIAVPLTLKPIALRLLPIASGQQSWTVVRDLRKVALKSHDNLPPIQKCFAIASR